MLSPKLIKVVIEDPSNKVVIEDYKKYILFL